MNKTAKITPAKFVQQVKQEASRVTWPTKNETLISTMMVLIMVALAACFFFLVDMAISSAIRLLLGL